MHMSVTRKFLQTARKEESKIFKFGNDALINMFRCVYQEVKLNIPFYSRCRMVQLLKQNGAQMGNHHYDRPQLEWSPSYQPICTKH